MRLSFIILFFSLVSVTTASERLPALNPESIGVAYLVGETDNNVSLRIVFPFVQVSGDPRYPEGFPGSAEYKSTILVIAKGQLVIFDAGGVLVLLDSFPQFKLKFWCENDGGMQFRPEAIATVPKSSLKRPLKADKELQGIAAFAYFQSELGKSREVKPVTSNSIVRMKGDLNGDGLPEALIWVGQDAAGNCDGKPNNKLTINLKTHKIDKPLRCCGP